MNLDNIPETVWDQLASLAMQQNPSAVLQVVLLRFYHIYENWSQDFKYEPSSELEARVTEAIWTEKVKSMERFTEATLRVKREREKREREISKGMQPKEVKELRPPVWGGYGIPFVQSERDPLQARIGEEYNQKVPVARFQFLVKTGGGVNLFDTMQKACQLYIEERLQGRTDDCVVQTWKVFSQTAGKGRSDSCVVYLTEPYTRPSVVDLVENYVWPRVKGGIEDRLELIGFFRISGKPIWALNLTQVSPQEQKACLGTVLFDSAGQNMGTVLGKAFAEAVKISKGKTEIIATAKKIAKGLLYDLRLLPWRPDDSTQNCAECEGAFAFNNRRHHCRVCGDIFCSNCCQKLNIKDITLPVEAPKGPESGNVYVCHTCHQKLTSPVSRMRVSL